MSDNYLEGSSRTSRNQWPRKIRVEEDAFGWGNTVEVEVVPATELEDERKAYETVERIKNDLYNALELVRPLLDRIELKPGDSIEYIREQVDAALGEIRR